MRGAMATRSTRQPVKRRHATRQAHRVALDGAEPDDTVILIDGHEIDLGVLSIPVAVDLVGER